MVFSIYFSIYLTSPVKIQSVRINNLLGDNNQYYSLGLEEIAENQWSTIYGFGPYTKEVNYFFDVNVVDTTGTNYLFRRHKLNVNDPRPDIMIEKDSFKFTGSKEIELALKIINDSDIALSGIELDLFKNSYSAGNTPIVSQVLNFSPGEKKAITVPVEKSLLSQGSSFFAVLDRSAILNEKNEVNNIDSTKLNFDFYNIPQNLGTTSDGINNDTISIKSLQIET